MSLIRLLLTLFAIAAPLAAQDAPPPPAAYQKDSEATQARPGPGRECLLWMNPLKWTWVKSDREDTEIYYHHTGVSQVRFIVTPEGKKPADQLADTVDRIRKVDPSVRIGFEENRIVNGSPVLCAQIIAGDTPEKEVVYYGYFYGDDDRAVQLFTITPRANMTDLYVDLTSLLNGLEITPKGQPQ